MGVNHLEGHVYAAWLRDPGQADGEEPVFPLVALVVSGGHTFLVEMTDHLTYRLLGQTVDDAAGEAFDKVGRLLGLPYPGGPAIQKRGRGRDAATTRRFPRAWLGDSYDFSFSGLKTAARRTVDAARADAGLREPEEPLPHAVTAELAWGFQDAVVDVLVVEDDPRPRARSARARSSSAAAWRRTRRSGRGWPARPRRSGVPLIVPRPGLCTDNGAMIGAAGARRFAAGERSGARPRGDAVAAARSVTRRAPTARPGRRGSTRSRFAGRCAARACAPATRGPRTSSPTRTCSRRSSTSPRRDRARASSRSGRGSGS